MSETLGLLGRSTLFLSLGFCLAATLLVVIRCRSWRVHRAVWGAVLLLGCIPLFAIGWTLNIPVPSNPKAADHVPDFVPAVVQSRDREEAVVPPKPLPDGRGSDFRDPVAEPPAMIVLDKEPHVQRSETCGPCTGPEIAISELGTEPEVTEIVPVARSASYVAVPIATVAEPGFRPTLGQAILGLWLGGMLLLALRAGWNVIRFQRALRDAAEPDAESGWSAEWAVLQQELGVRRPIPLLLAEGFGPALVRRLRGYVFLVPLEGWDQLSPRERQSIMRHELAHYRRGDIGFSLLARLLTLPHWFNPLAHFARRRFEETAEWACDEAALGAGGEAVATFAKALVSLHESALQTPNFSRAEPLLGHRVFGRDVSRRVVRILNFENTLQHKESTMKKAFLLTVLGLLFCTALVRIQLVAKTAEEPAKDTTPETAAAPPVAEASPQASPPKETDAIQALYERGKEAFLTNRWADARSLFEEFVKKHPSDDRNRYVLYYLGMIAKQEGKQEEAKHYFGQWIELFSKGNKQEEFQWDLDRIENEVNHYLFKQAVDEAKKEYKQVKDLYEKNIIPAEDLVKAEQKLTRAMLSWQEVEEKRLQKNSTRLATLNQQTAVARQNYLDVEAKYKLGQEGGRIGDLADAQLRLAEAEIALYRFTGEHERLLTALQARVDAARTRFEYSRKAVEVGLLPPSDTPEAEKRLAEAEKQLAETQKQLIEKLTYDIQLAKEETKVKLTQQLADIRSAEIEAGLKQPQEQAGAQPPPSAAVDPVYLELLLKRVQAAQAVLDEIDAVYQQGGPEGTAIKRADARIARQDAEAAYFRAKGEKQSLLNALQGKFAATNDKLTAVRNGYEFGKIQHSEVVNSEVQLAEAEYELKVAQREPQPPAAAPAKHDGAKKELLYQGKTFEDWEEQLETELDPKMRAEAFRALTTFGVNGRGREATEVILKAMKPYSCDSYDNSPIGQMKAVAIYAFVDRDVRIPLKDSFPLLLKNFVEGDENERSLSQQVFSRLAENPGPGAKEFLPAFYKTLMRWDVKDDPEKRWEALVRCLASFDPSGETMLRFLKETIEKQDEQHFLMVFFGFTSSWFGGQRTIAKEDYFRNSLKLHPKALIAQRTSRDGGETIQEEFELTPYGQSLLKLLREEGITSANEAIRETSGKVVAALEGVEKIAAEEAAEAGK